MSVQVDESGEEPEADNQNTAVPEETSSKDGEPNSFAENTKHWYQRHKPKIRVAVTLAVGLGLVVAAHRHEWHVGEDTGGSDPASDHKATAGPRLSALDLDRAPFLRRLPAGQHASEAAMERHRELTGDDLPSGYTSVRRWLFPSPWGPTAA
jgi:hypothetical protein